jgi:hypothetical protein
MLANILGAVRGGLGSSCTFKDGPEHLLDGSPPRVVAVPMEEALVAPEELWTEGPRALVQRDATVDFHLWGKTRADAESLIGRLVNVLRVEAGTSFRFGPGRWQQQTGEALRQAGRVYVLSVTFQIPVLEEAGGTGTVQTTDTTDTAFETA